MEIEELRERLKDLESNYEGEKERGRELSSILEEVRRSLVESVSNEVNLFSKIYLSYRS